MMVKKVITKRQLLDTLLQEESQIRLHGVEQLGIFGSFVHETQTKKSDVDVVVKFKHDEKTFDNYMNTVFLLESKLHRKVDLVTSESVSPYIKPHILEEVEYVF